mmetsp:Transcript_29487/g.90224  ORF Transcript_29487/g.90224 Transcript_29487/m.90224 type:complete len:350 (+) Transcript_29487:37-1086(+)
MRTDVVYEGRREGSSALGLLENDDYLEEQLGKASSKEKRGGGREERDKDAHDDERKTRRPTKLDEKDRRRSSTKKTEDSRKKTTTKAAAAAAEKRKDPNNKSMSFKGRSGDGAADELAGCEEDGVGGAVGAGFAVAGVAVGVGLGPLVVGGVVEDEAGAGCDGGVGTVDDHVREGVDEVGVEVEEGGGGGGGVAVGVGARWMELAFGAAHQEDGAADAREADAVEGPRQFRREQGPGVAAGVEEAETVVATRAVGFAANDEDARASERGRCAGASQRGQLLALPPPRGPQSRRQLHVFHGAARVPRRHVFNRRNEGLRRESVVRRKRRRPVVPRHHEAPVAQKTHAASS